MSIKLSFNNFKPFGENHQSIKQKPIILVYGPNSVGKSSLIDALLYYHNLKLADKKELSSAEYLNVTNQYFAGDELNLGGFDNMVHKKDVTKEISFSTSYDTTDRDIFKRFIPDFEVCSNLIGNKEVLDQYHGENFNKFIEQKLQKRKENTEDGNDVSKDIWNDIFDAYYSMKELILSSSRSFSLKKDQVEFSLEDDILCIEDMLDYMLYVAEIGNIKIVQKVGKKNSKLYSIIDFYVENSILFSCKFNGKDQEYKVFTHQLLEPLILIHERLGRIIHFDEDEVYRTKISEIKRIVRINTNGIEELLIDITNSIFDMKYTYTIQYIGPLRLVPSKNDLFQKDNRKIIDYRQSQKRKEYEYIEKISPKLYKKITKLEERYKKILTKIIEQKIIVITIEKIKKLHSEVKSKFKNLKAQRNFIALFEMVLIFPPLVFYIFLFSPILIIFILIILSYAFLHSYIIVKMTFPIRIEKVFNKIRYKFSSLLSPKSNLSSIGAVTSEKMWSDFVASKEMQAEIDRWLGNERLKSHYRVHIDLVEPSRMQKFFGNMGAKRLSFIDMKTNTKVFPNEMGTGISQVLPILISSKMRKDSIIFIEQPELHLHPALQSELADEFIESYTERDNSFVIETHSEHLLLRLMKRMRQTYEGTLEDESLTLTPDDIALLYVDTDGKNTFILELELDEDGTLLDQWPGGFFEEGFNERFL